MRRIEEGQRARAAQAQATIAEAQKRGACTHSKCLNLSGSGKVKFVKHRGACPNQRGGRR
jgi:hypothetical protein